MQQELIEMLEEIIQYVEVWKSQDQEVIDKAEALIEKAKNSAKEPAVPQGWRFEKDYGSITVFTPSGGSCVLWECGHGGVETLAYQMACMLAATSAAPSQETAVPQGWKATPANPDPDMVRAGWECLPSGTTLPWDYGARKCREVWAAMHAAARAAPAPAVPQGVIYEKADSLYKRGYTDRQNGKDYDPRGCDEWQEVVDWLTPAAPSQEPAVNLSCKSTQARLAAQWGYVPAPSQPVRGMPDVATWLWFRFVDYCRKQSMTPRHQKGLFAIVHDLRTMLASTTPPVHAAAQEPVTDEWICKIAKRYAVTIVDRHGHNAFLFTLAELLAFIASLREKEQVK